MSKYTSRDRENVRDIHPHGEFPVKDNDNFDMDRFSLECPDDLAGAFLRSLCLLVINGYFFKFGRSLKAPEYLLQVGKAGQSMRYFPFRTPGDLEALTRLLETGEL